ncbi:hypothetical protein BDW71DRAFT_194887 [Aspergillus fruticulosus]
MGESKTKHAPLPPNVDETTLDAFYDAVASKGGASNVSGDHTSGAPKGAHGHETYGDPGAVRPETVEELQSMITVAYRFRYRGSSPVVRGKIIEINEEYAYAIVEPGNWPSVPSLGWGPIVGNALDREFGYAPEREHSQMQCGMEVVLPNGELVRTGMRAMEGNNGLGPSVDELFFQSDLGVVTKIGMHWTPAPEAFVRCKVAVPHGELAPLMGISADLLCRRILTNSPRLANIVCIIMEPAGNAVVSSKIASLVSTSTTPDKVLREIQVEKEWPWWVNLFSLYGPRALVEMQLSVLHTNAPGQGLDAENAEHVAFAPVIPPLGQAIDHGYAFDFFADFHLFARYTIPIDLRRILLKDLTDMTVKLSYSEYRTHISFMDEVASHHTFNKEQWPGFDIISRGKSGIWNSSRM